MEANVLSEIAALAVLHPKGTAAIDQVLPAEFSWLSLGLNRIGLLDTSFTMEFTSRQPLCM